jgi:hypothetical protein
VCSLLDAGRIYCDWAAVLLLCIARSSVHSQVYVSPVACIMHGMLPQDCSVSQVQEWSLYAAYTDSLLLGPCCCALLAHTQVANTAAIRMPEALDMSSSLKPGSRFSLGIIASWECVAGCWLARAMQVWPPPVAGPRVMRVSCRPVARHTPLQAAKACGMGRVTKFLQH